MKRIILLLAVIACAARVASAQDYYPAAGGASGTSTVYDVTQFGITCDGTDQGTALTTLLATVSAAGGGTIFFPACTSTYRFDSQILIPNDSGSPQPRQSTLRFTGEGGKVFGGAAASGASILDLRYTSTNGNAKIESRGLGILEIDHLSITDGGSVNATPFVHATNTTTHVHDVSFRGSSLVTGRAVGATSNTDGYAIGVGTVTLASAGTGTIIVGDTIRFAGVDGLYTVTSGDADVSNGGSISFTPVLEEAIPAAATVVNMGGQDAIVFGGTATSVNGLVTGPFQGYGSTVVNNSFAFLNRGFYGLNWVNGVQVRGNTFVSNTGYVAIEFDCSNDATQSNHGNVVSDNLIELDVYAFAIKLTKSDRNLFVGNQFFDPDASMTSYVRLEANATQNTFMCGLCPTSFTEFSGNATALITTSKFNAIAGVTDIHAKGDQATDIAYGVAVRGTYDSADVYPGPLTVADQFNNNENLSFGIDHTNNRAVIESKNNASALDLHLNPVKLGRVFMPDLTVAGDVSTNVSIARGSAQSGNPFTVQWGASVNDLWTLSSGGTLTGATNATGTKYQLVLADSSESLRMSSVFRLMFNSTNNLSGGTIDVDVGRNAAGVFGPLAGHSFGLTSKAWINTAPTNPVACTTPTVTWSNGTAVFQIDVGSSCGTSTLVVTLPAVTNAYMCSATNVTTSATAAVEMTASTATSATFTNYTRTTGAALNWANGADVRIMCSGG